MIGPLVAVLLFPSLTSCLFSKDFSDWLLESYGPEIRKQLERIFSIRKDMILDLGSFGGKGSRNETVHHQPVVFVHGTAGSAWSMLGAARHFISKGYRWSEVYATTYRTNGREDLLSWTQYSMKCEYVKQIRALIVAVRFYTGQSVDVVAFSLGVPISRKAIMGGKCVDTGEDLGGPLTRIVDTYVGVAGPNHGAIQSLIGLQIPGCAIAHNLPICNPKDGLYSGKCPVKSTFLQDINRKKRYEGHKIYTIASTDDQVVGRKVCGKITTRIYGQDNEKLYNGLLHDPTFNESYDVQLRMVRDHVIV